MAKKQRWPSDSYHFPYSHSLQEDSEDHCIPGPSFVAHPDPGKDEGDVYLFEGLAA